MWPGSPKERPARAVLRKMRHQPCWRLSQQAPTGMNTCWMRGWSSSQVRGGHAVVRGQIVGDHVDVPDGVGVLDQLKELLVGDAVAGGGGHRDLLAIPDAQGAVVEPTEYSFSSVMCEDYAFHARSYATIARFERELARRAPVTRLNPLAWMVQNGCQDWPSEVTNPQRRLHIDGTPPILITDSRYDAATPHSWGATPTRWAARPCSSRTTLSATATTGSARARVTPSTRTSSL